MLIFYIIMVILSALLFSATVCTVSKMGEAENLVKYGYSEEDEKH